MTSKGDEITENEPQELVKTDEPLTSPDEALHTTMEKVFSNELLIHNILNELSVSDRKMVKLVSSIFRHELQRKRFTNDEFVTICGTFGYTEYCRLKESRILERAEINMALVDVEYNYDDYAHFWKNAGRKIRKISVKKTTIKKGMLRAMITHCPNLMEICIAKSSKFNEYTSTKKNDDPTDDIFPIDDSDPTKEGKFFLADYIKDYLFEFSSISKAIHIYLDKGNALAIVIDLLLPNIQLIGFQSWEETEEIRILTREQLDACPKLLPGWSTFSSARDNCQKTNPKWLTIEKLERRVLHMMLSVPPFLVYKKPKDRSKQN